MMSKAIKKVTLSVLLTFFAAAAVVPILLMLVNSFKTGSELAKNAWGIPSFWTFSNYSSLVSFNSGILVRTFLNSVFVSVVYTLLTLIVSSLAAFAFSKYSFKGKNVIFIFLLATMMIPVEITIPAIYLMFSKVHMLNTYSVQIFPGIANVFCLFMLKQYMDSLPNSLLEAARLDGAGDISIYQKVVLPLVSPAIGALAILTFLGKWNDYLWPSMLLTRTEVMPIMVVLPTLNTGNSQWSTPWELVMAGCVIVTLPLIIVFFIFQDQFMSSVTIGAVKE